MNPLLELLQNLRDFVMEVIEFQRGMGFGLVYALTNQALQSIHALGVVLVPFSPLVELAVLLVCAAVEALDHLTKVVQLVVGLLDFPLTRWSRPRRRAGTACSSRPVWGESRLRFLLPGRGRGRAVREERALCRLARHRSNGAVNGVMSPRSRRRRRAMVSHGVVRR